MSPGGPAGVGRSRTALDELGDRLARVRVRGWDGEHFIVLSDLDRLAERHEARFHPFGILATAVEERVRAELAEMGALISGSAVSVQRVDRMTPLTERRAGWVRKPLHDR